MILRLRVDLETSFFMSADPSTVAEARVFHIYFTTHGAGRRGASTLNFGFKFCGLASCAKPCRISVVSHQFGSAFKILNGKSRQVQDSLPQSGTRTQQVHVEYVRVTPDERKNPLRGAERARVQIWRTCVERLLRESSSQEKRIRRKRLQGRTRIPRERLETREWTPPNTHMPNNVSRIPPQNLFEKRLLWNGKWLVYL